MAGIGIMEGAYFVGRGELLTWINSFLNLNYTKIEQTASGVAHIMLLNSIHPGQIPMSKVVVDAKHDYEYIRNLKLLQEAFIRLGIDKVVDISRLSKAKYQDNLEFTQWMKRYWDIHYKGDWKPPAEYSIKLECGRAEANATKAQVIARIAASKGVAKKAPATTTSPPNAPSAPVAARPALRASNGTASSPKRAAPPKKDNGPTIASLQLLAEEIEKERDAYYAKLRNIEILFQSLPESASPEVKALKMQVIAILAGETEEVAPPAAPAQAVAALPANAPELTLSPLHL